MKDTEHKPGIHEQYVVKRRLKLATAPPGPGSELLAALEATPGVAEAELDGVRQRLLVAYDASTQNLDGVLEVLREHGISCATSWLSRFRVGWYRNTDANIHDNARHEPWSCHQNPRR